MSGGVDSSVAAALLVEQGYQVIGMMLRLWNERGREIENRCCTPESMALARRVAAQIGIPFYAVDAQQAHYHAVVESFIEGYTAGETPNPCLGCNRHVRWGLLLERARALGAEYLATGHYARVKKDAQGKFHLLKSKDLIKDQSYVLHVLDQIQLSQTLFPLGELTKPQVRQKALKLDLPVAERSDSQDLCFLGGEDYREFLLRNAPEVRKPGIILTQSGMELGTHSGLAFYTIGQRKGLGISSSKPIYVIAKDLKRNALIVGPAEQLGNNRLTASNINWISGKPPEEPFQSQVKIRYTAQPAPAVVSLMQGLKAQVYFENNLRDITPGQAAVFYDEDECLGGGIILAESLHDFM